MRAGPPSRLAVRPGDHLYCRLQPRPKQGGSLKFRCLRTNARNQLYDEDGHVVREAIAFDADGKLLDAARRELRDEDDNPIKGLELRVKYFHGSEPAPRYREMFTETVVSRLFWALGIPADAVYMPASVRCFGCAPHPFGQLVPVTSDEPHVFPLASVEVPYEGKKIAVTRGRGVFGLGGRYDHGWGFSEISVKDGSTASRRLQAEVLALALNIVAYNNLHSYQNDLVCRRGAWNKQTGECHEVVAYVSDVGGTLGGRRSFLVDGEGEPEMKWYPRGDFITFSQGAVFSDKTECRLHYEIGAIEQVSEDARRMMDERIRGRLGREQLRIIFEAASIQRLEQRVNDLVAATYGLTPGPELDYAVQLLWSDELSSRMQELLTARCPS
ncbi:MAG: hypothetical protein ACT4P7_12375 [Gemmatimonadaceae bacterium]